ncbi:MAG: tRNA lysidine(34) synthetase TilS [Candidatus Acidiferrales bacterium]
MRTPFEQFVLETIRKSGTLPAGSRVAVGVSGGADSVALLRLLDTLKSELGIALVVAHFNHTLRGSESDQDEAFVEKLAGNHDLEFVPVKQDVRAESQRNGWNLEDAGRRLRLQFFNRIVEEHRATCVALAHTADDQAETVLAQMIRGTGTTGLAGIFPVAGSIVRPLLEIRREPLREYLQEIGQSWREDSSNLDTQRLRARIREKLMPLLSNEFSPAITEHLATLARLSREESAFWDALVEQRFSALIKANGDALKIRASALLSPFDAAETSTIAAVRRNGNRFSPFRALTERLIRRLYKGIRGNLRELTSAHVEQVIRLAEHGASGGSVELPGRVTAERVFGSIVFSASAAQPAPETAKGTEKAGISYHYQVERPANQPRTVLVPELGTSFRLKVIDWSRMESETKREVVALDADLVHFPLVLRNWRPGDAYRPKGRRDERKLKQLLLANRVPSAARSTWPVLESDGRIIWAMGMPPSADFLVSPATRIGLVIEDAGFAVEPRK